MATTTKTSEEVRRGWIEAAKALASDPDAQILCPACDDAYLKIRDIDPGEEYDKFERQMSCPTCGSVEYMMLKKKGRAA